MSVYCVYISEYNYYVLNHNIHIHSTVYHLTHGKPVLNDIPWYSQFQHPIGSTTCNASALDFPPHGKRISGTQIGKTAVDENKAPGHIRMQDDAGGTIVVKSSVQYICLDLRPCSVDLCIFRTRIAQWGISILVGLVNWVSPPAAYPRVLTHPTVAVQRLIVPSSAIAQSCPRRQSGCCVRIPALHRRPPVRHPPPSAQSCRKHDIAWLYGLLVLAHALALLFCQRQVFGCAFGCAV